MNRNQIILIVEILSIIVATIGVTLCISAGVAYKSAIPGIIVAIGGTVSFFVAQYVKNYERKLMFKRRKFIEIPPLSSIDIIALICIIGCFAGILMGHANDVLAILTTVVGFYFGRVTSNTDPVEPPDPPDEEEEEERIYK